MVFMCVCGGVLDDWDWGWVGVKINAVLGGGKEDVHTLRVYDSRAM